MPPLNILIKPASSLCNLRCKYCFYHSLAEKRCEKSYGLMDTNVLEALVERAFEYADNICFFSFQGGEPTLVGNAFYRILIEYQNKYNVKKIQVVNSIQTNGTLLDEEWVSFLSENKFLVGISLDGPEDIHDLTRVDGNNDGSFVRVMETINLLNKFSVEYNILCVVNAYVANNAKQVYNFFKANNFRYLQYIECLDPLGEKLGRHQYSLTPDLFETFLKETFDQWYKDVLARNFISIRYFDNLISMLLGNSPEVCSMKGACDGYFVVEANGDVYPCDFYVFDEWKMGNINDAKLMELKQSLVLDTFQRSSHQISPKCHLCDWLSLCKGGCRRTREPLCNDKQPLNYYCSSYTNFFNYSISRLQHIVNLIQQRLL